MQISITAIALAFVAPILAAPVTDLVERAATESVFLVNCQNPNGAGGFPAGNRFSRLDFFDDGVANNGQDPGPNGTPEQFEGRTVSCTFDTGVTFTVSINSNGNSGTGNNGFKSFNCRKSSGKEFAVSGVTCNRIYECDAVSTKTVFSISAN
ncbi:MAG: hypothetical protein Q9227_009114 [Pyrenula ochraceoflavens]